MPTSTADLKAAYATPIEVTLPGGHVVLCRRPDLPDLLFHQVIHLPLLASILADFAAHTADGALQVDQFLTQAAPETAAFVDLWVRLVVTSTRIVATQAEATGDALWVGDLPLAAKSAIFAATFSMGTSEVRPTAAADFPAGGPAGDGDAAGSDGAAVRDAAVGDPGDA